MKKIRTAAYCRVSTALELQEGSYELQESYFTNLIETNPEMELAGIYGDKGKSGLSIAGRPGLQKLLEDCRAGRVDLILTKSISRLARNMADCSQIIQELRNLGVSIVFEKENINSQDEKFSLILNIFAAIAQEESHSISQHSILAYLQHVLEGKPYGPVSYGYRKEEDHTWVIDEEKAPLVRKAFKMAARGDRYPEIVKEINKMETSGRIWDQHGLKYMLRNEVYKGDFYSHKKVCIVPGKQVVNKGYRDRYYIKGHHEPIVQPELFDWVQKVLDRGLLHARREWNKGDEEFMRKGAV